MNTTVIGFFDCCRDNETKPITLAKGDDLYSSSNSEGRYVIFYPTRMGHRTYAMQDFSLATEVLIKHLSNCGASGDDVDLFEHVKNIVLSGAQILMSAVK